MKSTDQTPTLDDIIFEKRNKAFGAYELRTNYHGRLNKSLAITVSFLISVFLLAIVKKKGADTNFVKPADGIIVFEDKFTIQQYSIPKGTPSSPVSKPDDQSFVAVTDTVDNDREIDTTSVTSPIGKDTLSGLAGSGFSADTVVSQPFLPSEGAPKNMSAVDKIPEFPGGLEKFYKYLSNRLRYTDEARRAEVKGKLFVRFVIDENGLVSDVTVMSKIGYGLDEQVTSVLAESPKWSPGIFRNSAVKTEMILPVSFNIR